METQLRPNLTTLHWIPSTLVAWSLNFSLLKLHVDESGGIRLALLLNLVRMSITRGY